MGGRFLMVVVALLAAVEGTANASSTPLFPEGDDFYFDVDPSDPRYSDMFSEERYITPMIPEDVTPKVGRYITPAIPEDVSVFSDAMSKRDTSTDDQLPVMCGTYSLSAGQTIAFASPNYPAPYTSKFKCAWTFEAEDDGQELEMTCSDFLLAESLDSLRIKSDGTGKAVYKLSNTPPLTTTEGGVLKARFKSDKKINAKGFRCVVRNIGSSVTTTTTAASTTTADSNDIPLSHPKCGIKNGRIINGVETTPNEYPWQVRILTIWSDRRGASCGGSIINELWVLTAAHCISRRNKDGSLIPVSRIRVTVGAHLRNNPGAHGGYNVEAVVPPSAHSNYAFPSHDISLLRLQKFLTFTQNVAPVCLPPSSWATYDFLRREITMSGWGKTESGSASIHLRHVLTTGYPLTSCSAIYGSGVDSTVLCTDGSQVKKVCSGDSGGPVTVPENGRRFLVGVVSFTGGCLSTNPDGHARVAYFIDWIESTTGIDFGID